MKWLDDIKKYYIFRALIRRFVWPILILHMLNVGVTVEQVAIITALGYIVGVLFEIPSGAVADVIGHKRILVLAMIGQSISMLLYLGGSFWWMLAGTMLFFFAGSFLTGTHEALFYELLIKLGRTNEHQKFVGRARAAAGAVGIIFMLSISAIYVWLWWLPFIIGFAQFILAAIVISTFGKTKQNILVKEREGFMKTVFHFKQASKQIRSVPLLYWIIITQSLIIGISVGAIQLHQVIFKDIGLAVILFGVVYALKRVMALVFSPLAHVFSKWFSAPTFFLINAVIMVFHFLVIPLTSNAIIIVLVILLNSASINVMKVVSNDYTNILIPSGSRATALSISNLAQGILIALVAWVMGWLSQFMEIRMIYGILGIVCAVLFVIVFPFLYRVQSLHRKTLV